MSENQLETAENSTSDTETAIDGAEHDDTPASTQPSYLPEKFWDPENNEVRTESMAKAYVDLERKLGSQGGLNIPEDPSGYEIDTTSGKVTSDPEVNVRLHEAGFSQEQTQLVYELAAERMMPLVGEIALQIQGHNEAKRLVDHFGGENKWLETARQIENWGSKKFPREHFEALTSSYEGVLSLHRMMTNNEPEMSRGGDTVSGVMSEAAIKDMMRDPRYWRDRDPAIVERVQEGFKRLFPNEG